jgi:hypothetical protein
MGQVDSVVVADNLSQDGTYDWLQTEAAREYGDRLLVTADHERGYFQSQKMSRLAAYAARHLGAEWVVPFDADEWWYSPFGRIADVLSEHPGAVATAEIYDHRATGADPDEPNPIKRMGWRTIDPLPLHKIACRPLLPVTITQGNHGAHYPTQEPLTGQLVIRHYPLRSVAGMIRKARTGAAAYAATDLPIEVGQHWRGWGQLSDEQLDEVFHTYYFSADPEADPTLIYDPAP